MSVIGTSWPFCVQHSIFLYGNLISGNSTPYFRAFYLFPIRFLYRMTIKSHFGILRKICLFAILRKSCKKRCIVLSWKKYTVTGYKRQHQLSVYHYHRVRAVAKMNSITSITIASLALANAASLPTSNGTEPKANWIDVCNYQDPTGYKCCYEGMVGHKYLVTPQNIDWFSHQKECE